MTDRRIVYGFRCSWWGSVTEAGRTASGLPGCPQCSGVLMEVEDAGVWWRGVDEAEAAGRRDYRAFITWLQGKCYPTLDDARRVFDSVEAL